MTREEEQNMKCIRCMEEARKNNNPPDYLYCMNFCQNGREIHNDDKKKNPDWDGINWNHWMYEDLCHH